MRQCMPLRQTNILVDSGEESLAPTQMKYIGIGVTGYPGSVSL